MVPPGRECSRAQGQAPLRLQRGAHDQMGTRPPIPSDEMPGQISTVRTGSTLGQISTVHGCSTRGQICTVQRAKSAPGVASHASAQRAASTERERAAWVWCLRRNRRSVAWLSRTPATVTLADCSVCAAHQHTHAHTHTYTQRAAN
eukprot:2497720-Rhodomonas_salina.4